MKYEILLAVHNSERFLEPQLLSLLQQTETDFHLRISDDCSTDSSVDIIRKYAPFFKNNVELVERDILSGSAKANFADLIQKSKGSYVFLSDHDDTWDADKISVMGKAIEDIERVMGKETPIFLFSNARIIDGKGAIKGIDYWSFKKIKPQESYVLARGLICPPMLGCASVMNRALVDLVADMPVDKVTGHDWWAFLVAASLGHVGYVDRATVSYRIHGSNASKPKEVSVRSFARLARGIFETSAQVRRKLDLLRNQAEPLLEQFQSRIPPDKSITIERFLSTRQQGFFLRRWTLLRHGYTFPDTLRNLVWIAFC